MKNILGQILALIVLAVLVWWVVTHQRPSEPTQKDREREYIKQLNQKQAEIKRLHREYDSIVWKMYNDSLEFETRINAYNEQINRLKKNAKKIDLKTANPAALDSLTSAIYPSPR